MVIKILHREYDAEVNQRGYMMLELYEHHNRTAHKQHTCEYCGESIAAGQQYSYETGKWDGEFFVRKLCLTCEMILSEFMSESGEEEFDWPYVTDHLVEHHCMSCPRYHEECDEVPSRCNNIRKEYAPSTVATCD